MKKLVVTVIVSTALITVWNAVSWMVLPFHSSSLKNLPADAAIPGMLNGLEAGVYHYPGLPTQHTAEEISKLEMKLKTGPRMPLMVVYKKPSALFDGGAFLANTLFSALGIATLYLVFSGLHIPQNKVFLYSMLMAGLVAVTADLPTLTWYKFPAGYVLATLLDRVAFGILAGLVFRYYSFTGKRAG